MVEAEAEKAARELAQLREEAAQGLHSTLLPVLPVPTTARREPKDARFDSKPPARQPSAYEASRARSHRQALAHSAVYHKRGR